VVYNYKPKDPAQRPGRTEVPEFVRLQFDETARLQKEAAMDAQDGIRDVEERVQGLERRVLGRKEMT
jgi:hypothetical protein